MTPDGTDPLPSAPESTTPLMERPQAPLTTPSFPPGNLHTEQTSDPCPATNLLSQPTAAQNHQPADCQQDWCYVYLHNRKISAFKSYMDHNSPFRSFVMRARPPRRKAEGRNTEKTEDTATTCRPPQQLIIGGIVFLQGKPRDLQHFFKEKTIPLNLVRDCATQRPAVLPDSMMRPLRQVVELASERLGFLPRPFEHYAQGHDRVRIIEGPLRGLEGCILRIDRDRKLVMQVGTLTLAIARAHREIFEPIAPAAAPSATQPPLRRTLTFLQQQLDKSLFFPQSQADVATYADNIALLTRRALQFLDDGKQETATDALLFLLDEISYHFSSHIISLQGTSHPSSASFDLAPIHAARRHLISTITRLTSASDPRLTPAEKDRLATEFDARMMSQLH